MKGEKYLQSRIDKLDHSSPAIGSKVLIRVLLILAMAIMLIVPCYFMVTYRHNNPDDWEVRQYFNDRAKELIQERTTGKISQEEFERETKMLGKDPKGDYIRDH
jgi:uncharacterized membrane protein